MKRAVCLLLLVLLCQTMAVADGFYLNSLGSRASAMGGAFVGLADDLSAVFWNPAGIAQFDKRYFGFYGGHLIPQGSYKRDSYAPGLGNITLIDAKTQTKPYLSGLAAYYHPLSDRWVAGIALYTPCCFGMSWEGADLAPMANSNTSIDWMSRVGITTISPTIGYRMSRSVSIGASININRGVFELGRYAGVFNFPLPEPPYLLPIELGQYSESLSGWGYGATVGILVKPNDLFSVGATVRTASLVKYQGYAWVDGFPELGDAFSRDLKQVSEVEKTITWPLCLALGGAFSPCHDLTLTADLQWTNWATWDVLKTEYQDPLWTSYMSERGNDTMEMSWENTLQVRLGIEYHLSDSLAIRGGYYIAPSPSPEETRNVLLPTYNFRAMTFGFGYRFKNFLMDLGLEYATSWKREDIFSDIPVYPPAASSIWEDVNPGDYNMNMLVLSLSLGYRFGSIS